MQTRGPVIEGKKLRSVLGEGVGDSYVRGMVFRAAMERERVQTVGKKGGGGGGVKGGRVGKDLVSRSVIQIVEKKRNHASLGAKNQKPKKHREHSADQQKAPKRLVQCVHAALIDR